MHTRGVSLAVLTALLAAMAVGRARADYNLPSFFVSDPTRNSQDWTSAVYAAGGQVNNDIDFRAMPPGVLRSSLYNSPAHPDGVTLTASDSSIDNIVVGPGPNQGGAYGTVSTGEGISTLPEYLLSTSPGPGGHSSLTISFAAPVMAVGLFTIDYFGSDPSTNELTLSLYSGADGRGTLLGTASAVRNDFQPDALYFMGFAASTNLIGSAVFRRGPDADFDAIGIGPILFATQPAHPDVAPEPSTIALLALGGALALGSAARRRRRRSGF